MRKLTNIDLLMAAVVVTTLTFVNFVLPTSVDPTATILLAIGATALVALSFRIVQLQTHRNGRSWLNKPVSDTFGRRLINTVVGAWLAVITATFALMAVVFHQSSNLLVAIVVSTFVGAGLAGRLIKNKYHSTNLLPYGIAFTLALAVATFIFALVVPRH